MEPIKISLQFIPLPHLKIESPTAASSSLQLFFKISGQSIHKEIVELADGTQDTLDDIIDPPVEACVWIDAALFANSTGKVYLKIFPVLKSIGILRTEDLLSVLWKITEHVQVMERSVPKRRKVMVIEVKIVMEIIRRYRYTPLESDLERALRESRMEHENRNYGMVGAAKNSLKKMMKLVEVEGDQECRICLDEIENESFGMCMPCDHVFHSDCILKWLQTSRYCPLCRFEMPS